MLQEKSWRLNMANIATSDAVLTAFFAVDGVCDKLELAVGPLKASTVATLTALQAKHGAATAFTSKDTEKMIYALSEYLKKAR
jgi:hypothetical protein